MLAYYDSHYGLVPVKIISVYRQGMRWEIYASITANKPRGGYKRGQKIVSSPLWVFPRHKIIKNKYLTAYNPEVEYAGLIKKTVEECHDKKATRRSRDSNSKVVRL